MDNILYEPSGELLWLLVFGMLGWKWWQVHHLQEITSSVLSEQGQLLGFELVSDSVSLSSAWLKKDNQGHWQPWHSYLFEMRAGNGDLYEGKLVMLGHEVTGFHLECYKRVH